MKKRIKEWKVYNDDFDIEREYELEERERLNELSLNKQIIEILNLDSNQAGKLELILNEYSSDESYPDEVLLDVLKEELGLSRFEMFQLVEILRFHGFEGNYRAVEYQEENRSLSPLKRASYARRKESKSERIKRIRESARKDYKRNKRKFSEGVVTNFGSTSKSYRELHPKTGNDNIELSIADVLKIKLFERKAQKAKRMR